MPNEMNALGQAVGWRVDAWTPPPTPPLEPMTGRTCRVEPLNVEAHAADLHAANRRDEEGRNWTYLPYGPFDTLDAYAAWLTRRGGRRRSAVSRRGRPRKRQGRRRRQLPPHRPAAGSIEVGHINYSPLLQRTIAATEAMYLMMKRAFDLGYRRYEWKCNALNAPSRAAALRLGFSYEGVFRQARVDKGRNRDTAWYAMVDKEWPLLDGAFRRWLDPVEFRSSEDASASRSAP